jgi:hypothetical protein
MSESEMSPLAPAELSDQVSALRQQVFTLMLALIIVSGTLATYLYYQSRILGRDITNIKPQAVQVIQTFNQDRPQLERLVNQLIAYGQSHPDFQRQILDKYNIRPALKK